MIWEYFCDSGYFDMWCVRRIAERRFNNPESFHLLNEEEANRLCDFLNSREGDQ